jgi:hypothetical protein
MLFCVDRWTSFDELKEEEKNSGKVLDEPREAPTFLIHFQL